MTRRRRLSRLAFAQLAGLLGLLVFAGAGARPSWAASTDVLDVVVVVDTSSRAQAQLARGRDAALQYIGALPARSRVAVVPFGQFPVVSRDLRPVDAALRSSIRALKPEGGSPLLDALSLAADQFDPLAETKRVIVAVSDGRDLGSRSSIASVRNQLVRRKVQLQALALAPPPAPVPAPGTATTQPAASTDVLQQLVFATKGDLVVAVDHAAVVAMAQRTGQQADEAARAAGVYDNKLERFLNSRTGYLSGVAAIFVAAAVVLLLVTAPKPEKVHFDLITAPTPTGARALVGRLSSVADDALEKRGKRGALETRLERSGLDLRPGEFLMVVAAVAVGGGGVGWLTSGPLIGAIVAAATLLLSRTFLRSRTRRRQAAFSMQLGDTLGLLCGNLRAGHGLLRSLESVHQEAENPTSQEFGRVVVETRLGRDLSEALHALAERMQCDDLKWVIPAIDLNREVGGDLARVLDNIGQTIRDRSDIKRQVKTLSAEGRLSAYVLIALPFVLLGVLQLASPRYLGDLTHGIGLALSGGAALLMGIGTAWLLKLCKIEY